MHIDYAKGCYWAHDAAMNGAPSHADMQAAGWRWIKSANAWMTGDANKAIKLREYARGDAKDRLDALYTERQIALAASCALTSNITVKAPPGCAYRPYQLAGIEYTLDKDAVLLADDMRLGKAQGVDEPVLTPDGWRKIGTLRVGDFVIGSKGTAVRVTGVYPQGKLDEYEITTVDGATARASADHLWAYFTSTGRLKTTTTKAMLDGGLTRPSNPNSLRYHIPIIAPVQGFDSQPLCVDPSSLRVNSTGLKDIRPTGRIVDMVCISVDADDHLYVTSDYILTHNTIQAVGVMNTFEKPARVLVICPSTPKRNWYREIKKWLVHDLEVGICDGKKNPETPVLIINYDILHTHKDYLDSVHWDIIVCDESHYLKNPKARRTKMVFGYKKKVQSLSAEFWLFMSGSQMFKTPVDLFTVVQKCDPQGLGKSWWDFVHRYCDAKNDGFGLDTSGASNLEELQYLMRTRFMCRRTKKDVAGDMPSNRQTISLPRSGLVDKLVKQERDEVEKNFGAFSALLGSVMNEEAVDELLTEYSFLDGLERDDDRNVTLVGNLARIRRELAVAKTPMCIDFINDVLENEDKVVIFAHHRDVIDLMKAAFPDAAVVRGGMADKVKDAEVVRFQTDPACRVFIGNIVAAGQAINLSVADVAIFIEISWVPSEVSQAEERIWDVLKTRPNTIYRLPVEGSLDEAMIAVVEQRQEDVNKAMNMEALT